jgi:outer membrane protein assembly factor BamB
MKMIRVLAFLAPALRSALGFAVMWSVFSLGVADAQPILKHVFKNPNPAVQDFFGNSVAMEGNYVLIGAKGDDTDASNAGRAYLFDATTGNLLHTFRDPNPVAQTRFGSNVALSGNFIVIGKQEEQLGPGRAFVFDAVTGNLLHTLLNPQPAAGDSFGFNVAIDGNRIVVGAALDDSVASNAGQAFLFDATTGALLRSIRHPTPAPLDVFGASVDIEGETIVVGATLDDTGALDTGQALVFDATTGNFRFAINNPSPAVSAFFSGNVGISGNKILVSEVRNDTYGIDAGIAYVFDATTGARLHTFHDPIPPTSSELFGVGSHVSGNDVFFGTDTNLKGTLPPIPTQVFHFDAVTGDLLHTFEDPSQVNYYTSFGHSISESDNRLLISAPGNFSDISARFGPGQVFLYDLSVPEPSSIWLLSTAVGFMYLRRQTCIDSKVACNGHNHFVSCLRGRICKGPV